MRVFMPVDMNRFGFARTGRLHTLGDYYIYRAPSEVDPRLGMQATRMVRGLGANAPAQPFGYGAIDPLSNPRQYAPVIAFAAPAIAPQPAAPTSIVRQPVFIFPVSEQLQPGQVSPGASPTPVAQVAPAPAPAQATPPAITSGGGTATVAPAASPPASAVQSPATTNITVAPAASDATTGTLSAISAWLGGSTQIGSWGIPNALLVGVVVLGFAFLSGGKKK